HVVLHINTVQQNDWEDTEVIARYQRLHRIPDWLETADEQRVTDTIGLWRERLGSVSWFMKCINEPLARMANHEDGCKGRFWEGRFRSQALLDEESVLKCMAYVDLNPIRAQMAQTPEESDHTSIQARIEDRDQILAPLYDRNKKEKSEAFSLPISQPDYLQLVDYTGRQLRSGKRGRIPATVPPIVERLSKTCTRHWLDEMSQLTRHYVRAMGNLLSLGDYRDFLGQTKLKGLRS
ncbi:MAG: transposase, partial [Gammaproteobacteria bacterium]|nr:transposase [Gammaproteobacteria bacterium]